MALHSTTYRAVPDYPDYPDTGQPSLTVYGHGSSVYAPELCTNISDSRWGPLLVLLDRVD